MFIHLPKPQNPVGSKLYNLNFDIMEPNPNKLSSSNPDEKPKPSSSGRRENRFEKAGGSRSEKLKTLKEKREATQRERDEEKARLNKQEPIQADYKCRGLDFCYYCAEKFNVGEKIPRILIHCGHTFCTECLTGLHHNFRVRCPICRKLVK